MVTRKTRYGIALLSALTLLTWWATRQQEIEDTEERVEIDAQLDYALMNFELRHFNAEGEPAVLLRSPSFKSDSATGDGLITKPELEVRHKGFLWNIIADSATVTDAQDFIYLNGDVRLVRNGGRPEDWLQIDSGEVALEVAPRIATSNMPVQVRDLAGQMNATGFSVNMTNNQFELDHDVEAVYVLP